MRNMLQRVSSVMARSWCQAMHPDPMWPIRGSYRCPRCLRTYPVPWEYSANTVQLEHARLVTPAEAARLTAGPTSVRLTALPPAA